jgi:hypothetical protein
MHPPRFLYSHRLSDWQECCLQMHCRLCEQRSAVMQVKGLMRWYGNRTFAEILSRLRCQFCRRRPSAVFLKTIRSADSNAAQGDQWTLDLVRADEKLPFKDSRAPTA